MSETNRSTTKRRGFLRTLGGVATLGSAGIALSDRAEAASQAQGRFKGDPFTLGVASGDPLPDSVVLWTALLKTTHGVGIVRYWFEAMKSRSWIWQSSSSTSLRRHYA